MLLFSKLILRFKSIHTCSFVKVFEIAQIGHLVNNMLFIGALSDILKLGLLFPVQMAANFHLSGACKNSAQFGNKNNILCFVSRCLQDWKQG